MKYRRKEESNHETFDSVYVARQEKMRLTYRWHKVKCDHEESTWLNPGVKSEAIGQNYSMRGRCFSFSDAALIIVEKAVHVIQCSPYFTGERAGVHRASFSAHSWFDEEPARRSRSLALHLTDPASSLLFLLFMSLLESMRQYWKISSLWEKRFNDNDDINSKITFSLRGSKHFTYIILSQKSPSWWKVNK